MITSLLDGLVNVNITSTTILSILPSLYWVGHVVQFSQGGVGHMCTHFVAGMSDGFGTLFRWQVPHLFPVPFPSASIFFAWTMRSSNVKGMVTVVIFLLTQNRCGEDTNLPLQKPSKFEIHTWCCCSQNHQAVVWANQHSKSIMLLTLKNTSYFSTRIESC